MGELNRRKGLSWSWMNCLLEKPARREARAIANFGLPLILATLRAVAAIWVHTLRQHLDAARIASWQPKVVINLLQNEAKMINGVKCGFLEVDARHALDTA